MFTGLSDAEILFFQCIGTAISLMLMAISFFIVSTARMLSKQNEKQDDRMDKMMEFMELQQDQILKQQGEIKELNSRMDNTINLVKTNQENDSKNIQFMRDLLLGKLKLAGS